MTSHPKEGNLPLSTQNHRKGLLTGVLVLASLLAVGTATAQKTNSIEIDTIPDFMKGDITTSTLTWEGRVAPPIHREQLAPIDAEVVWDVVELDNRRYIATGHEGKLLVEDGSGEATVLHDFDEPSIYTLHVTSDGKLLVAPSPGGEIHQIDPDTGEATLFARTGASTVWDMVDFAGGLAIATGPKGSIIKVSDDGTTSTLVQFPDTLNVLDLALIPDSEDLVVATQGPGIVARVTPEGTYKVLIDPQQDEVRRVVVLEDGSIVAAVNGIRSPGEKLLQPAGEAGRPGGNAKPRPESFLARVYQDGFVEEWWTSPEAPIHDVASGPNGTVLVAAGERGLFYEVSAEGETSVRGVADESFLTRLAPGADGSLIVATGAEASILRLHPEKFGKGIYESEVLDGMGTVRWSRIRGILDAAGGTIHLSTRTGNTAKPDDSWNEWTDAVDFTAAATHPSHGEHLVGSPVGRFLQFRLEMEAADGAQVAPSVDVIRVFHTRPNAAPVVREISVQAPGSSSGNTGGGASRPPQAQVRPGGDAGAASRGGAPATDVNITWSAQDPDGDELRFDVYLRKVGDIHWLPLESDLDAPRASLSLREVPDGEYRVKVVANDSPSNPADLVRTSSRESAVFTLDTTPPTIHLRGDVVRTGDTATVSVVVEDSVSLISAARWRLGFGDWQVVFPDDGAFDSRSERFTFTIDDPALNQPGMFVMVSATDAAGNIATTRIDLD